MLFVIHWKSFEFSTWLTREMFVWLKNSTLGISNSEDFHYLHWRLVADYPGHVTTYFRTQCQRPVHPKDLICDTWHSIKIKYPYTKPQSPTPFNSNSHPSHFCTKLWSKTLGSRYTSALIAQRLARSLRERKVPGSNPTVGKNFSFSNSRFVLLIVRVSPCKWNQPWHTPS